MGTLLVIVLFLVLGFLALWAKADNDVKANDWKQEQNNELDRLGIVNSVEYYYAFDTLAYTARYIVDNDNKKIAIYTSTSGFIKNKVKVIDFNDVLGVEIFIDSQTCGGIKRALVGGLIAGGDGAIVGALTSKKEITSMKLVIYTRDVLNPEYTIELLGSNTKTSSSNYINSDNFAKKVSASIKAILAECDSSKLNTSSRQISRDASQDNATAELKKMKALFEEGLISKEDYDAKKKQILGL